MATTETNSTGSNSTGSNSTGASSIANSTANGWKPVDGPLDALVVGAGFGGLYMLYRLREMGLRTLAIDTASGVGGTWYHNRYPGARCDIPSTDYSYSFDPELERAWTWSEKYATQPEILAYLNMVADRYDLRRDIRFGTTLVDAAWNDATSTWTATVRSGDATDSVDARFVIMATGCLSVPKDPEIEGADAFDGEVYVTGRWPHEPVDFSGKRVAVIGTGSSGIQSIPIIAEQADAVTVFQRTPNFSMPALNGPAYEPAAAAFAADRDGYREAARWTRVGVVVPVATERAVDLDDDELRRRYEQVWETGHLIAPSMVVSDLGIDEAANETFAQFVRDKIHEVVDDPALADLLSPNDYPYGTKRPCLDTGYYETFNRDNVALVNLRADPIERITATGIETQHHTFDVDVIVYATGFDAMTGAIVAVDIAGRDGETLRDHWDGGPNTYLGLMSHGFPNLFAITGPGSPSVLSNMAVSIEQHVEWIADALAYMGDHGFTEIEPTELAEAGWTTHVDDFAALSLFPKANSWYMGANVPGKTVRMLPYIGGVGTYRRYATDVVERGYLGFHLSGANGSQTNDGIIARVQPDVQAVLDAFAALDLPPLQTMTPTEAREFDFASKANQPPGPEVAAEIDGTFPGADGDLAFRAYVPPSTGDGPLPVVVYYHGGGWVLGNERRDEPMVRDLCLQSEALIVSLDYRHGPWHKFPAAADDAWAGLRWVHDNVAQLGGDPERIALAGFSAGGNLAAVTAQRARDEGGPALRAQLLVTPVTDTRTDTGSYIANADGFILTRELMQWFLDQYVDDADRANPKVAPLRGELENLPPACVIVCELDPLHDEGEAYATALMAAHNSVELIEARGQIHTSLAMVDIVRSAAIYRQQAGWFLRDALAP